MIVKYWHYCHFLRMTMRLLFSATVVIPPRNISVTYTSRVQEYELGTLPRMSTCLEKENMKEKAYITNTTMSFTSTSVVETTSDSLTTLRYLGSYLRSYLP